MGAGIAGGADVILIPEIPYHVEKIAEAIRRRSRHGTNFSIVAVAEGAKSVDDARAFAAAENRKDKATEPHERNEAKLDLAALEGKHSGNTLRLAKQLEELTHLESRVTILGYVQRGGTPSPADRLLATRLGSACADLIHEGVFGVMVAARGDGTEPVPLGKSCRQTQNRSPKPSVGGNRAKSGNVPGGLTFDDRRTRCRARAENCGFNAGFLFVVRGDFFGNRFNCTGLYQGYRATAKSAAGHAAAVNSTFDADGFSNFNHGIQFAATDFVIVA